MQDWLTIRVGNIQGRNERLKRILKTTKAKTIEQYTAARLDQIINLIIESTNV